MADEFVRLDGLRDVVRSCKDILGKIEHRAAVAIRHADQGLPRIGRKRQRLPKHRLCPLQQVLKVLIGEALEDQHLRARQKRAVQLERWIFGRGADQNDRAVLDIGQKGILLGSVEAVDLVDEKDSPLAETLPVAGRLEHLPQILHA